MFLDVMHYSYLSIFSLIRSTASCFSTSSDSLIVAVFFSDRVFYCVKFFAGDYIYAIEQVQLIYIVVVSVVFNLINRFYSTLLDLFYVLSVIPLISLALLFTLEAGFAAACLNREGRFVLNCLGFVFCRLIYCMEFFINSFFDSMVLLLPSLLMSSWNFSF